MAVHELDVLDELILLIVNERDDPCAGLLMEVMQHVHHERYRDNIRRIERTEPAFQDPLRVRDGPCQRIPQELHRARVVHVIFFERFQTIQGSLHHFGKSLCVIALERLPPPDEVVLPEELDQLQRERKPRRRRPVLHQAHGVVRAAVEQRVGELGPGEMQLVDLREEELGSRSPEQVAEFVPDLVDAREPERVPVQFFLPDDRQAFRHHRRGDPLEVGRGDQRAGPEFGLIFVEKMTPRIPAFVRVRNAILAERLRRAEEWRLLRGPRAAVALLVFLARPARTGGIDWKLLAHGRYLLFSHLAATMRFPGGAVRRGKPTAIQMIDPLHHQISPGPEPEETGESTP